MLHFDPKNSKIRLVPFMIATTSYLPVGIMLGEALADARPPILVAGMFVVYALPALMTQVTPWHPAVRAMAIPLGLMATVVLYPVCAWLLRLLGFDPANRSFEVLAIAWASLPFLNYILFQSRLFRKEVADVQE